MPFSLRSYRGFPVQCAVTNNSGTCIKQPLSTQNGHSRCRFAVHEDTAVIELLLTRPERKVER
jgi:hypothetical protein